MAEAAVAVADMIVEMTMEHCCTPICVKTYHDMS
jgi:hypothetical protein